MIVVDDHSRALESTDPGFPLDLAFTVTAGAPIPARVSARG